MNQDAESTVVDEGQAEEAEERSVVYCEVCGAGPVAFQEGCFLCLSCGASKCS